MKCKKIFALLLSLCMVFSTFVTVVNADPLTTITVGSVEATAGTEVVVPVSIANNTVGICGLTLNIKYDASALTYVNAAQGDALTSLALTKPGSGHTPGDITFAMDAMDADYSNGTVLNITFNVAAGATGDNAIDVIVKTMCDFEFNDIENTTVAGKVTIPGGATTDKTTIAVGDVAAAAGDTITVPVTLANNTVGFCGLTMNVKYDASVLTYTNATQGDALASLALTKPGSGHTPGNITFAMDAMDADYTNGTVLNIAFKVADNAKGGDYTVDVTIVTACDFDFNDIEVDAVDGTVSVEGAKVTTITVGNVTGVKRGEKAIVPVTLANNTAGICGLTLNVKYDSSVLTYTNATQGDALASLALTKPGSGHTPGNITFAMDAMDADYTNGTVLNIEFTVADNASGGDYPVDVTVVTACDFDFNDIEVETVDGIVNIDAPIHVHDYVGVVTKEATHTEDGVETFTCSCGDSYTEVIPAKVDDHSYVSVVTKEATHTEDGVKTFTCECGDSYTEVIPAKVDDHSYVSVVTKEATHTEEGVKTFTCECGDTYTEAIAKLPDHIWDAGVVTKEPTHIEKGVKTYTCICGETYTEDIPENADDHTYVGVVTKEPTHTEDGVKTFTCECGDSYTESLPADVDAHTYVSVVTKEATCTEDGVKTFTCECGDTYTEVIPMFGHDYSDWTKDDDDNHKKVCATCGDVVTEAHTWNAGVITVKPTYGKNGEKTYTCPICNGTKIEVLPMKDAAETDITVTVGEVTARAGQEIVIPVSISNNSGLTGLQLGIDYDPELLTLTSVDKGTALAGLEFTPAGDLSEDSLVFVWDGLDADTTTGDIIYFNFTISNTAVGGEYIPAIYVIMTADENAEETPVFVKSGKISIIEYTYGDVDGDGEVDVQDVVFLRRHLVGGYNQSITAEAGDVYRDGQVETNDLVYLRRYVIGGYGVEFPVWPPKN